MNNASVFKSFVKHNLIVATPIVRDIIANFPYTCNTLLGSLAKEIESFVKETHRTNSAKTVNAKILIPRNNVFTQKCSLRA